MPLKIQSHYITVASKLENLPRRGIMTGAKPSRAVA